MTLSRRFFLSGLGAVALAAPAIVHAGNLMPVKAWAMPDGDIDYLVPGEFMQSLIRISGSRSMDGLYEVAWDNGVGHLRRSVHDIHWDGNEALTPLA